MSNNESAIVLNPKQLVWLSLLGGVSIGFGIFGIVHYLTLSKKQQNEPQRKGAASSPSSYNQRYSRLRLPVSSMPTSNTLSPSPGPRVSRLSRHFSEEKLFDENDDLFTLDPKDQMKALKEQNKQLQNFLAIARTSRYDISNPNTLSASDIETIRSIFDAFDADQDGCVTDQELCDIYSKLGEPLTEQEAIDILKELDPRKSNSIPFDSFVNWWHNSHRGYKKNASYSKKFKFICGKIKGAFDPKKLMIKAVGAKNTTDFRFVFNYEQKNGKLKQISPWHDIPLYYMREEQHIYNFICEVPKWTRAKYEIATGESFNPIHQDVKNGKLRFYQHGDMMFNYGALPQTWENPKLIHEMTHCPGDNDPLDVIEFGTRQLKTGSITPCKILGVLSLLDSGETDWKLLAININDPLANLMNDVHDIESRMPGAIHAIREYLRIYKVCTGQSENKYAFRGEALNADYAIKIIQECHEEWKNLNEQHISTV